MHTHLTRGILISIEGIDGSGKSTLSRNLHAQFTADAIATLLTKEPGDCSIGGPIRTILQNHETPLDPKAEYLLFAADRAQHITQVVKPSLEQHMLVISDRMADSSLVYQGIGRGLSLDIITSVNAWAMSGIEPDLVLFVTLDPDLAFERLQQRATTPTRFEQQDRDFFKRIADGFITLAKSRKNSILIDGSQDINTVTKTAYSAINSWIQNNHLIGQ